MFIDDKTLKQKLANVYFIWGRGKTTIADLIALAPQHKVILCEGDIDYAAVIPLASHAVHLQNRGTGFDWFDRPDHIGSLDAVKNRGDISQAEKDAIIANAYAAVSGNEGALPDWVVKYGVKNIAWDDSTGIDATALETAEYFRF